MFLLLFSCVFITKQDIDDRHSRQDTSDTGLISAWGE